MINIYTFYKFFATRQSKIVAMPTATESYKLI